MANLGTLYLIPVMLGETSPEVVLPHSVFQTVSQIDSFIVENSKVARRFIKAICPEKQQSALQLFELNKHTNNQEFQSFLAPLLHGKSMGLMSDAGCPGIADPGANIIALAHENGIKVVPLVGPSSILLALMASGMNGQQFAFHGYLPIDKNEKKYKIKQLEKISVEQQQSQIFIETPYRNNQMMDDLIKSLHPNTSLCVACDITLKTEFIVTKKVKDWKKTKPDLHKRPCIFIFHSR